MTTTKATQSRRYDVAVVGGGAAGLSAALVLTRARRSVIVVDSGRPRNAAAASMHGFLGRDGTSPADLLADGRREVSAYGAHLVHGVVIDARRTSDDAFAVTLEDDAVTARRMLVTTGLTDQTLDIPGVRERWGLDVLHCPYCHGYEVRDQPLGILGDGPAAVEHALLLRQWSHDVVYFDHSLTTTDEERERLTACAVGVVDGPVSRLVLSDDRLAGVELATGQVVPRTAVFVRPHLVPNADLLARLGCALDERGWPVADASGLTTVDGLWTAGNAVNPRAQVITAAGEGSAAAIAINADLVAADAAHSLLAFRAGLPA